jgi:hypothetical protein
MRRELLLPWIVLGLALAGCTDKKETHLLTGEWVGIVEQQPRRKHADPLIEAVINWRGPPPTFKITDRVLEIDQTVERVDKNGEPISFPPLRYRREGRDRLLVWHEGQEGKRQRLALHWGREGDKLTFCLEGGGAPPRSMLWLFRYRDGAPVCDPAKPSWQRIKR